jgi:hypothetical protein
LFLLNKVINNQNNNAESIPTNTCIPTGSEERDNINSNILLGFLISANIQQK